MKFSVIGIIFTVLGAVLFIKPELLFTLTESWKSNSSPEPSRLYIISTKIGAAAFFIIGILSLIFYFIN